MKTIKFKKLKIKNFKCHKELDFDFSQNKLVSLTGSNGSGKTSIIDALVFALYDQTTKGIRADDVVNKRVNKDCCVELEFDIDKDSYIIKTYRKDTKFKNSKFIIKNGEDITGVIKSDTNQYISDLLVSYDIFVNSILFTQFSDKSFMEMKDSGKKELLNQILSLDKYEEYYEKTSNEIKELESNKINIETNSTRLESEKNIITEELESYDLKLKELKESHENYIIELKNEINEIKKEIKSISIDEKKYNSLTDKKDKLSKDLIDISGDMKVFKETIKNEKEKLETKKDKDITIIELSVKEENKELQKLEMELNSIDDEFPQLVSNNSIVVGSISSEYKSKINEIKQLYSETEKDISKEISEIKEKGTLWKTKKEEATSNINELDEKIKKYEESLNKKVPICPTCEQEIKDKELNKVKEELKIKKSEKDSIEETITKYNKHLKELSKQYKDKESELHNLKEQLEKELEIQKDIYNSKLDKEEKSFIKKQNDVKDRRISKNKELESFKEKIKNIISEKEKSILEEFDICLKSLKQEYEIKTKRFNERIEKLNTEIDSISNKLSCLDSDKSKLDKLTNWLESREHVLKTQIEYYEKSISEISNNIKKYSEKLKEADNKIEQINKDLKNISKEINIVKFWKTAFSDSGIKGIILDESIPILNEKAKEICESTNNISVRFDSQKATKSGELRNKFAINAINTKNLSNFKEFSAGETRMTNIIILMCLRHLIEKMNNINFNVLLLDESLDSLDQENSDLVCDMLKNVSNKYCILLISHSLRDSIKADEYIKL